MREELTKAHASSAERGHASLLHHHVGHEGMHILLHVHTMIHVADVDLVASDVSTDVCEQIPMQE